MMDGWGGPMTDADFMRATTKGAQPRYETICGTCGAEHLLSQKYNHNFVARGAQPSAGAQTYEEFRTHANATIAELQRLNWELSQRLAEVERKLAKK